MSTRTTHVVDLRSPHPDPTLDMVSAEVLGAGLVELCIMGDTGDVMTGIMVVIDGTVVLKVTRFKEIKILEEVCLP